MGRTLLTILLGNGVCILQLLKLAFYRLHPAQLIQRSERVTRGCATVTGEKPFHCSFDILRKDLFGVQLQRGFAPGGPHDSVGLETNPVQRMAQGTL